MRLDAFDLATVHSQRASSHPFRLGRNKERHEVCNFFRLPVAANESEAKRPAEVGQFSRGP